MCCSHALLSCHEQPYNLTYLIAKRMVSVKGRTNKVLPYEMLLTRLFHHVVKRVNCYLYSLHDPVMSPLSLDTYRCLYWDGSDDDSNEKSRNETPTSEQEPKTP